MPLIVLSGPSVPNPYGSIVSITNGKEGFGMDWTYQMIGGWYQGARSYTNTMIVVTNSPLVGPIQVQQALIGIGAVQGSTYLRPLPEYSASTGINNLAATEIDTGSFLHRLSVKQSAEDVKQWLCTFEYGPFDIQHELGTSQAASGSVYPLDAAPDVQWSATEYEASYPTDVNGMPFLNTVGDVLENPPRRVEARQVLDFVRNEATFTEAWAQAYRQACNSDTFLGFSPNQAKCKIINGQRVYTADYGYYWRVTYQFEFRTITITNSDGTTTVYGWEDPVLNCGFNQWDAVNNVPKRILASGQPTASPSALTQGGAAINAAGWNPTAPPGVNAIPYYLVFQNFVQQPFSFLNIPTDVLTANQ